MIGKGYKGDFADKRISFSWIFVVLIIQQSCFVGTTDARSLRLGLLSRLRHFLFDVWIKVSRPSHKQMGDFMINGVQSTKSAWPWVASLQYLNNFDGSYYHVCGATLITDEWLLTAAHCVDDQVQSDEGRSNPDYYRVMLGSVNLYFPDADAQFIDVSEIIKNSAWNPQPKEGFPNDIALIRLASKADVTGDIVGTLDLLTDVSVDLAVFECWIAGWGLTSPSDQYPAEILQQGMTPVVPNDACQLLMPLPILSTNVCVGGTDLPRACEGDSGSPLMCRNGGDWKLVGIGSWSTVDCSSYSVDTRTVDYIEWIDENISA